MALDQEQKKVWAGLKRPSTDVSEVKEDIDSLKANDITWSDFVDGANNSADYTEFKTFLTNNGLTSIEADNLISKIQGQYADYSSFVGDLSNYSSYQEWKSAFNSQTVIGGSGGQESTAGVKVYKEAGVGANGQSIPKDGIEVKGVEVHFSEAAPSSGEPIFNVTNFRTDDPDNVVTVYADITISVDVENTSSIPGEKTLTLTEDGNAIRSTTEYLFANSSTTVSFTLSKNEYVCHDYAINGIGNETVCWAPAGLQI